MEANRAGWSGSTRRCEATCQLSRVSRSSWLSSCATGRRAPSFPIAHVIHQMRREIPPRDSSSHLRRRRSTKREICSFSLVQHLSRPPSIDGPLGRVTPFDPAVPYRQIPMHTVSRKHVRNSESERVSRKKAQVPREEELSQSGCSTTGTCPTGVLLRASTAIVHVRPMACLFCHPISLKCVVVVVCSCSLATFLGRPHDGPQM